jgi:hypothetical protein
MISIMMLAIRTIISAILIVSLFLSAFYSIKSRRQPEPQRKGLLAAKMNISMGVFLITIGLSEVILNTMNTLRLIIASIFLVMGLYNLFAGMRNRQYYGSQDR